VNVDQRVGRAALRVLVADDDPSVRLLCRVNLEADEIRVVEASDGVTAVERCLADPPDVLLLDVMMPALSGWEVAARLRRDDPAHELPIIFLTALTTEEAERRVETYGGSYLAKPFDPLDLPRLVRAVARATDGR